MEIFQDNQPNEEERAPTDYTGLVIGVLLLPVFFLLVYLANADIALAACVVLAAIVVAIKMRWSLRKHFWFWGTIVFILVLHLPLILILRWPHGNIPTLFYAMPIGIVDFFIILWAVDAAEQLFSKRSSSENASEHND